MIRPLNAEALDGCVSLYVDTFNAPPWNESWSTGDAAQRLGDFLATPRAIGVWSPDPDGTVLGFAVGHLERAGSEDHFLLQEMCVRASLQRRGHGTRLLEALTQQLDGVRHWYLLTATRQRGVCVLRTQRLPPRRTHGCLRPPVTPGRRHSLR